MAEAIYREQDVYAERVSSILQSHGYLTEDEEEQMRSFLRGW